MAIDLEHVANRQTVWETAGKMIDPIIEHHGLENQNIGTIFVSTSLVSKVEQHIEHVCRVADWLLEE